MRNIADNLLDLAQNSIDAGATLIEIEITVKNEGITLKVADNGRGMGKEILDKCLQSSFSLKGTKGIGLSLFDEDCGGSVSVKSIEGKGTVVEGTLLTNDYIGFGKDIAEGIAPLLDDEFDVSLSVNLNERTYTFDTRDIKRELNCVSLHDPCVIVAVKRIINENISRIGGAKL